MLDVVNIDILQILIDIFTPVELAVLELGKRDTTSRKALISIENAII
jgi:hypothetical protein